MPYYEITFNPTSGFADWIESVIGKRPIAVRRKTNPSKWAIEFQPDLTPAERQQLRDAMPLTLRILFDFSRKEGTLTVPIEI